MFLLEISKIYNFINNKKLFLSIKNNKKKLLDIILFDKFFLCQLFK